MPARLKYLDPATSIESWGSDRLRVIYLNENLADSLRERARQLLERRGFSEEEILHPKGRLATKRFAHWSKLPGVREATCSKVGKYERTEKIRQMLRYERTPETREKLRVASLGKKQSEELILRKRWAMLGKKGPNKGRIFSEEVRKRMSIARKGKTLFSAEHRRKLSEKSKGHLPYSTKIISKMVWYTDTVGRKIHMASSYEAKVAEYLDSIREPWLYVGKSFAHSLLLQDGRRYYPDFYLSDRIVYIDPKGFDRDPEKRIAVETQYPGEVVFLMGKTYLEQLKELLCQCST
jgi:hypothetical protein